MIIRLLVGRSVTPPGESREEGGPSQHYSTLFPVVPSKTTSAVLATAETGYAVIGSFPLVIGHRSKSQLLSRGRIITSHPGTLDVV